MADVIMPRLSDSMEEGTILRWFKQDGEEVKRGEELLEIETDKATMTYEADVSGTLTITEQEGAVVAVGAVIGHLGDGASVTEARTGEAPAAETPAVEAPAAEAPAGQPPAAEAPAGAPAGEAPSPAQRSAAASGAANGGGTATLAPPRARDGVKASPMARRAAQRLGVELSSVNGSGPSGRILKADVLAAADSALAAPGQPAEVAAPAPAVAAAASGRDGVEVQELSRTQTLIARRMSESRASVPEFALEVDVDMSAALEMRGRLKALADPAPSLNDIIVKACALALRRHPRVNGSYRDGHFELHANVNVGIAVAAENALIVPTVFDADRESVGAIATASRRLVERVRERTITPSELDGATFTISNLGMYGIDRFEGIINAPQAAILCVGAIGDRPVAVDGEVVVRPIMSMTLACDHRILYGADAAEFLSELRKILQEPLAIVL
jgi:pyruvate dehydrogenase E2 component (dihydrolipoamide acetyltransferase)